MFDKLLFQAQFNTGQTIRLNTADGMILDSCDANIGTLKGKARTVPAILCDGASDTEQWKILNVVDSNGMFLDHVAIKGAVSDDQAYRLCHKYLREARRGQLNSPVEVSNNGLKTFLDSVKLPSGTSYFLEVDAPLLDAQGTVNAVQWDDEGNLVSHGGRFSQMMLDAAGCDIEGHLLEQVTPRDIVAMLLDDTCEVISRGMFDAMIIKYNQFEKVVQKIAEALKASDNEDFFVKTVTPIEPFKRQGVVNVGAIFEMSDTQTITVLFNNPDTTPAKLSGTDILTSWKWILNKRDVTAILQPRAVDARKYPQLATRMLKVLAKNHDRFKRAQLARSKEELLLEELTNQLEASQSELRSLQQQGTDIQSQIDEETTRKQQQTETIAATPTAPSKSDVIGKFEKIIDILTGQHDFKVEFRGEDAEALEQMHVTLLDKNERDVNFIVTEGVQGAGLEYRISTNAYSFSWDIKDSAEQTAQAIADASGEVKDRTEGGVDEITDATDPEQYAKIIDDDAQLTEWQDPLDSFFQSRLIDTRNALRELGWTGERFKDLSKDGHTLVMDLKQVGGGANVVGVTYSVSGTDFSVRDDLKLDAQALASLIDGAVQSQAAATLSPNELDQLVTDFAISKGMQEANGYQVLGNLSLMSRPAMGDVILLAGNPNEENNGFRESKTIAEVTGNEIFELTAEKLESVFGPLIDQEIERLKAGAPALKPSSYAIKNTNPRARKPRGTITLKPLESDQSGNYEVTIVKDGVGGQFLGTIKEIKNWLIHRLMDMGEAVSDNGYTFADTAQKLDLIIGDDVLGIKTLPENPYQNAALIDLAKGVVKELAALGWEKSGSTVVKTIDVNGEPSRLKFDFNPAKKGKEIWIKNDNGESIGEFAMPELTEIGVKGKAQEMDAFVTEFANSANAAKEQNVQMNNDKAGGIVLKAEAEDAYRMLDYLVNDFQGHTADEFKRADVPGKFKPWIEKAEAVLKRKFRNESYRAEIERSIERANETIARWERVQAEAAPQTPPVVESEQDVQMNNDEQFLNDVIAGAVDLLANDTGDRIEQIGENLDPALESLFEQAIDAYSQAAIKNAQSMG